MIHATVKVDKKLNLPQVANWLLLKFMDARETALKHLGKCDNPNCHYPHWKKD